MKRITGFLLCLLLLASTVLTVDAQDRRKRSRFGRKARTVAIIGGGTAAGALIGGKKGAAIGAGGSTIYAMNRKAARRNFKRSNRRWATVAGGTLAGAGVGGAIGRKKGAAIGALAGAGGSYIYTKRHRHYRRRY
jgi:outer membrane lipoprotein SlyB